MGRHLAPHHQQSEDDALARLLAAERDLAERLAAAREEADEIVRVAREQAQRIEEACATTIMERTNALADQYETHLRSDLSEIARESQRIASLFAGVDDVRIEPYVALVRDSLLPSPEAETAR